MSKSIPKAFERQMIRSLQHVMPGAWVHKNPDVGSTAVGYHQPSPPDIICIGKDHNLLIECKAAKGTSIPFNRLGDHQKKHLQEFDRVGNGIVAVLAYNGLLGKARRYEGWMIPIREWCRLEAELGRASLPISQSTTAHLYPYHMTWVLGQDRFDIRHALHNAIGGRW